MTAAVSPDQTVGPAALPEASVRSERARVREWLGVFGTVGSTQVLVQALAFVGGILIVRFLSPAQYALYTLANAMLATMNSLADGGISSGIMAEGGKVWRDPERLGSVIATGLSLRRWFAVGGILVAGPILVYLLGTHGASWALAVVLAAVVVINFWFCALGSVYNVAPALHQRLAQIQRIAALQGMGRVLGLVLAVTAIPSALVALVTTTVAQAWASFRLRGATLEIVAAGQQEDPGARAVMFSSVRRILPSAIYLGLSGQLSIWLISICGDTDALARLGALGRLGQGFAIFSAFAAAVFVPRFARLRASKLLVLKRYFQTIGLILVAGGMCVCVVAVFPRAALWILGAPYQNLTREVVLQAACSLSWFTAGIGYSLAAARGLAIRPQVSIPLQIVGQLGLISVMNLSSVAGLLRMGILLAAWQIVIYLADTVLQIKSQTDASG